MTRHKKFSKAVAPGTQVSLAVNPERFYTVSEVSEGRTYIRIEGFTGIFTHNHIANYSNKPVETAKA